MRNWLHVQITCFPPGYAMASYMVLALVSQAKLLSYAHFTSTCCPPQKIYKWFLNTIAKELSSKHLLLVNPWLWATQDRGVFT